MEFEIRKDYSQEPINSLCYQCPSQKVQFMCFESADPLQLMLSNFYVLCDKHRSDLFQHIWISKLNDVNDTLTIPDVVTKIWDPVFSECCQLIESVYSRSIKLKDVDRLFKCIERESITNHLKNLFLAIESCRNRRQPVSFSWINIAVERIKLYWSLCEKAEAANIVLDLKDRLQLTGKFNLIEKVAYQINASIKNESLDFIDQSMVDTIAFLNQFTEESWKLECLRKFSNCMDIVEWLRKETKGLWAR